MILVAIAAATSSTMACAMQALPLPQTIDSGWRLQDSAKVAQSGAAISAAGFDASGWYAATVPGTVLTTLVNNHVYPEPLYGENNRPEHIPESLGHTAWWYRAVVEVPASYKGRRVWLNFEGVNYAARVWVNGAEVGAMQGAFRRGVFDVTAHATPGQKAVVTVLVAPEPTPGVPHEHTLKSGMGLNGGVTATDGPTFLATIGWDWIPAIRDRDTGIWQKVFLSATGPVRVKNPLVTTDLPLPRTDSSDLTVEATVENVSAQPVRGVLAGSIENIRFARTVELAAHSRKRVRFTVKDTPVLHMEHPRLWWPNGYGAANLYQLHLSFRNGAVESDAQQVSFGVRKIEYSLPGADTLTISVNGVPVFIRGGNWGMDEAMKRLDPVRMDAQIRMHKLANLNLIRNWVGQSTSEEFYSLCDKYGILVWDEFFQPNPSDGPNPTDLKTYVANVRAKILRYRNHPSILLWCARNEGFPPPQIDAALRKLMAEVEPVRRYQPSSTDGPGVRSHGPYNWREPRKYYTVTDDFFKTETGSMSVPTLESIHGMMPEKDWNTINDDWAEHDFARGAQHGDSYPQELATRYGKVANLADFVRKAQMMNFEAYRAMYEGRNSGLFHPDTAVITWMSNPAQPSFTWQLYHYDLEPNASLFAVQSAGEMRHIQLNEADGLVQVVNNQPEALEDATARIRVYNLNGALVYENEEKVAAPASAVTNLAPLQLPTSVSPVHFVELMLQDAVGKELSRNFYWQGTADKPDDLTALETMERVPLEVKAAAKDAGGRRTITVTLANPSSHVALMTHLQLRSASGERVLPVFYSANYVTLAPGEERTLTIEAAVSDFNGEEALLVFDGWNTTVAAAELEGVFVAPNQEADPTLQPPTGLPFQTRDLRP
ncbi:glycosyl hydrolase 2 galactose-binding domain-containing protein [Telmatobacter bradus]|uniref:glycoside hydrolase family 2 protein n=1 Tax=Telmatobacter bradus TaxID=474953 RepID=UPI003B42F07C